MFCFLLLLYFASCSKFIGRLQFTTCCSVHSKCRNIHSPCFQQYLLSWSSSNCCLLFIPVNCTFYFRLSAYSKTSVLNFNPVLHVFILQRVPIVFRRICTEISFARMVVWQHCTKFCYYTVLANQTQSSPLVAPKCLQLIVHVLELEIFKGRFLSPAQCIKQYL